MKYFKLFILILFIGVLCLNAQPKGSDISVFSQSDYQQRREALMQLLDSNSVVVLYAAEYQVRSNDVNYPFRQESNFFYLTGINEPNYYLIVSKRKIQLDGKYYNSFLFAPLEKSKNNLPNIEGDLILDNAKFYTVFSEIVKNSAKIFTSFNNYRVIKDWLNDKVILSERNAKKDFQKKFPDVEVKSITTLTSRLREIKSKKEVDLIRRAIKITGDGLLRAMKVCKPGMFEYEIQADIEYEMYRQGASGTGFSSIIASGENSLILHYDRNNKQMNEGDLLLMDVGAEFEGYSADITRTIPVSGKFTKAQKEVYEVVLKAQKEVINIIKPGVTIVQLNNKANQIIKEAGYGKFIKHNISHHLGLDTHDSWLSDTLRAGMVITVEPGIYIPVGADSVAPEYQGFGIRIEDDVLVTEYGNEVLSNSIPKEIDDIEMIMKSSKK